MKKDFNPKLLKLKRIVRELQDQLLSEQQKEENVAIDSQGKYYFDKERESEVLYLSEMDPPEEENNSKEDKKKDEPIED